MNIKYNDINQPREQFLATLAEFREKIGNKDFWAKPCNIRQISIEALTQDYLRTEHGDNLNDDAIMLEVTLNEYHMRDLYIQKHPINKKGDKQDES